MVLFLILIVITVGQVTYNIVKEQSLTFKNILPSLLFVVGIVVYAFYIMLSLL
jgi:NAD(P)H-quinone oxidoreductase subunit 5